MRRPLDRRGQPGKIEPQALVGTPQHTDVACRGGPLSYNAQGLQIHDRAPVPAVLIGDHELRPEVRERMPLVMIEGSQIGGLEHVQEPEDLRPDRGTTVATGPPQRALKPPKASVWFRRTARPSMRAVAQREPICRVLRFEPYAK